MTEQERKQQFLKEYEGIKAKYGFDFQTYFSKEQLSTEGGDIEFRLRVGMTCLPVPDWQPLDSGKKTE